MQKNEKSPKIIFTKFDNCRDTKGTVLHMTWREFRECPHEVRGDERQQHSRGLLDHFKDGDAVILGECVGGKTKAHLRDVYMIGLDIDDVEDEELNGVFNSLSRYEYWAYTTHKHRSEYVGGRQRWRIILPLAKPVPGDIAEYTWRELAERVGISPLGPVDKSGSNSNRLHYLPSTFDIDVAEQRHNYGDLLEPIDIDPGKMVTRVFLDTASSNTANSVVGWLSRVRKDAAGREPLMAMVKGDVYAKEGDRHNASIAATMLLAHRFPDLSDRELGDLISTSVRKTGGDTVRQVIDSYRTAVAKIEDTKDVLATEREEERRQAQARGKERLDEGDIELLAAKLGWTVELLNRHWLIQKGREVWIMGLDGKYRGRYCKDDAKIMVHKLLACTPLRLAEKTKSGIKRLPYDSIMVDYGSIADHVTSSLVLQGHTYDPVTRTMTEAACPLRITEPEFNKEIHEWLLALGGTDSEILLDWIACVPDLSKLLCALYMGGFPGAGKSLLMHGLARLWTTGRPSSLERVLGNFNDDIIRCPLIFADEKTTSNKWSQETITQDLREMVAASSHSLQRKFRDASSVDGCIRLGLAANNEFLLKTAGVQTARDLRAIAERFLYIDVPESAKHFFDNIDRTKIDEEWIKGGAIARHALWLNQNREVAPPTDGRFWVSGSVGRMHHVLISSSTWNSLVCEWLVRYLQNPRPYDGLGKQLVIRGDGALYVNPQAIGDCWTTYFTGNKTREPMANQIALGLRALTCGEIVEDKITFSEVDIDVLKAWARTNLKNTKGIDESLQVTQERR